MITTYNDSITGVFNKTVIDTLAGVMVLARNSAPLELEFCG